MGHYIVCVCVLILFNHTNYSLKSMLSACGYQCAAFVCVPSQTSRWFFLLNLVCVGDFRLAEGSPADRRPLCGCCCTHGGRNEKIKIKENFSTKSRENATDTCSQRGVWVNECVYIYLSVWSGERAERGHRVRTDHALARHRTKKKKKKPSLHLVCSNVKKVERG